MPECECFFLFFCFFSPPVGIFCGFYLYEVFVFVFGGGCFLRGCSFQILFIYFILSVFFLLYIYILIFFAPFCVLCFSSVYVCL